MVPLLSSIGLQAASHAKAAFSTASFSKFDPINNKGYLKCNKTVDSI